MAASQDSPTTTTSRCTPETAQGRHIFEVKGYSLLRGIGVAEFIQSASFSVGGHNWCISFYPDGDDGYQKYVSIYLFLLNETSSKVRVMYDFRLLNPITGVFSSVHAGTCVLTDDCPAQGRADFMKRRKLERLYLRDDRLVIECDLTVILGMPVSKSESMCEIQVPPSDVLDNLGKLLESEEGADVTLKVQGEVFHAHRIVLAMRSPVFKAEFLGLMSSHRSAKGITLNIEDMQPTVFQALLHFIYNDTLPAMDHLDQDENEEMSKHLLVAADRYAIERMKVICERILSKKLEVETVATTLSLANQHHCSQLKDACIEFINSSNRLKDVVNSQGYAHLKRACPTVIVEILEKSAKSRKI